MIYPKNCVIIILYYPPLPYNISKSMVMKRKILISFLAVCLLIPCAALISACGGNANGNGNDSGLIPHTHSIDNGGEYVTTNSTHSYVCSCGETITENHVYDADYVCTICGYAHEHTAEDGTVLDFNDFGHTFTCSCGMTTEEDHSYHYDNTCALCDYDLNPSEGLEFTLTTGGATTMPAEYEVYELTGIGTCTDKDIRIPFWYNGKPVTRIARCAFYQEDGITSVLFPNAIRQIDEWAFARMPDLESLTVACEGFVVLGDYVFYDNPLLKTVDIPAPVVTFGNCNRATISGKYIFAECPSLKEITFPDSLNSLGDYAFYNSGIERIYGTGENLRIVGLYAFKGTPYASNEEHKENGILYAAKCAIAVDDNVTDVILKEDTIAVASHAFYNSNIETFTAPEGFTTVNKYAFRKCTKLTTINIPKSVKYIYNYAYYSSDNLSTVNYAGSAEDWEKINNYSELPSGCRLVCNG